MSKFLCLGMPLLEVVRAATEAPAKALRREELGGFKENGVGDASVFAIEEGKFCYVDSTAEQMMGSLRLVPRGIVLSGRWWESYVVG
jgi:dihydroorotase